MEVRRKKYKDLEGNHVSTVATAFRTGRTYYDDTYYSHAQPFVSGSLRSLSSTPVGSTLFLLTADLVARFLLPAPIPFAILSPLSFISREVSHDNELQSSATVNPKTQGCSPLFTRNKKMHAWSFIV